MYFRICEASQRNQGWEQEIKLMRIKDRVRFCQTDHVRCGRARLGERTAYSTGEFERIAKGEGIKPLWKVQNRSPFQLDWKE